MVVVGLVVKTVAFFTSIVGRLSSMREARYLWVKQEKLIVKLQCANNGGGTHSKAVHAERASAPFEVVRAS